MKTIVKILLTLLATCFVVITLGALLATTMSKDSEKIEPSIEQPKVELRDEVRVSTPSQLDDISKDQEDYLVLVFKNGFIENCTKSGESSYSTCLCGYNYIYEKLGNAGLLKEALSYSENRRMSDNMYKIIKAAALSCI